MRLTCAAMVVVFVATSATAAEHRFRWWQSEVVQTEVRLTPQQVLAIEHVYQATLPERRALRLELDRLEAKLQRLLDRGEPAEHTADVLIDQVEAARARRNVARAMMLFRIRRMLTPEQRSALAREAARVR